MINQILVLFVTVIVLFFIFGKFYFRVLITDFRHYFWVDPCSTSVIKTLDQLSLTLLLCLYS